MTNTVIEASLLNRSHLGQKVRVTVDGSECIDVLRSVSHEASMVSMGRICSGVNEYVVGRAETNITLLHFGELQVAGNSPVELFPA